MNDHADIVDHRRDGELRIIDQRIASLPETLEVEAADDDETSN